ncbi:Uncharacterized protein GNX_2695 [Leptospira interrogans serovar Canicola]|nr:Uncharacterized protein GNX_2695 [Leptospira interrogans serovar Canicola]
MISKTRFAIWVTYNIGTTPPITSTVRSPTAAKPTASHLALRALSIKYIGPERYLPESVLVLKRIASVDETNRSGMIKKRGNPYPK